MLGTHRLSVSNTAELCQLMAFPRFCFLSSFLYLLTPSKGILNFLRSIYPKWRPIFVCNLTRWYWYGDEEHCKRCLYEVVFESLERATLANLEYAAESGCRRCRIILLGVRQFLSDWQGRDRKKVTVQVWDTAGPGIEVLVGYDDHDNDTSRKVNGQMALEFYFHEGSCLVIGPYFANV